MATVTATLTVVPLSLAPAEPAAAQPNGDWDPGYIITDANFYAGSAMSASEVQSFLNGQVSSCASGYTCLKDYRQSVPNMPSSAYCAPLTGGNMSAAELIVAISVSCNVSPKALIVLLQKEQSLITSTAPSDGRYTSATGFSCPDTAPCDPAFGGFFYQVYYAARQFQVYKLRPEQFNFEAGGTYAIQYNPDTSCGTRVVTITNAATAGLYNYTPYTPNSAAMSNLYGIGDWCSSYGNRNFWRIWWDWFGNPREKSGPEYIADTYAAQGGATGWLGAASGAAVSLSGGWMRAFAGGSIYWSGSTGAQVVSGEILTKYLALGGPSSWLGWPFGGGATSLTSHALAGKWQWFQGGTMYWTASSGAHVVQGATKTLYASVGAVAGRAGWPVTDETRVTTGGGGVWQSFMTGSLTLRTNGVTAVTWDAVNDYYLSQSGPSGWLGWPDANEVPWTAGGVSGVYQYFQSGTVYSSSALGVAAVKSGPIRTTYAAAGGSTGPLGWPTGDETCDGSASCIQQFQRGAVYSTVTYGAYAVSGGMYTHYSSQGGPTGSLGWPTSIASCNSGGVCVQEFEAGVMTWDPANGGTASGPAPHTTSGAIGSLYSSMGGQSGALGAPTSGTLRNSTGTWQIFENGMIALRGSLATAVVGSVWPKYRDAGGPLGWLGWPTAKELPWSAQSLNGSYQDFQNGLIYFTTPTGAVTLATGPLRSTYAATGGSLGPLGWPTADAVTVAGGQSQQFQSGAMYVTGGKAYPVVGAAATKYASTGGPTGWLGWPIASQSPWSANGLDGSYQDFQSGLIYATPATGAVTLASGPLRTLYGAAGGSRGQLGWPTADAACDGQRCRQSFQGGDLYRSASAAFAMYEPVLGKFAALGGTTGSLGWPTSAAQTWSANGVNGTYTNFENGLIYQSATTGTVMLATGPIRTAYGAANGGLGYLGWPTADAVCDGSQRCEQVFQGGRIYQNGAGFALSGDILTKYQALGGPGGSLGWPISGANAWTASGVSGAYTSFDSGLIYSSATTGAVSVASGPIRNAYGAIGGSLGTLGWPTADAVCDGSGNCSQQFQGGEVRAVASGGTSYGIPGPMLDAYLAAGGAGGALGLPGSTALVAKAADLKNGSGAVTTVGTTGAWQYFAGTSVIMYWTQAYGAHTIATGPIRTYYGTLGGLAGSTLGFPISDQVCSGDTCTQTFEHGSIVSDSAGTRRVQ